MRISLYPEALSSILEVLAKDETFIECHFSFQIAGKNDGEEFMLNDSAAFVKLENGDMGVIHNGRKHDLRAWLDCDDYDDACVDAISISHVTLKEK
jgi:hypothetical protein